MNKPFFLLLVFPFLVLGCGADKSQGAADDAPADTPVATPAAPEGAGVAQAQPKMWELSVFGDPARYTQVPKEVKITVYMDFIKNELIGEAGCNSYTAPFQLADEGLVVSDIVTTKKACAPEVMALEKGYLDLLREVTTYDRTTEVLTMETGDGKRLIFTYWVTE